jgi:hypothetical protein
MVDVKELLNTWLLIAKDDRARHKYSEDESFVPKVAIIGPNDEIFVAGAAWRNEQQKYAMMEAIADTARKLVAQAVVFVSDARWLLSAQFCDHFKIEQPGNVEAYKQQYLAILREHGGQMKNLPRHLWREAVTVGIKGPRCGSHVLMAPYDQGPNDTVHYLPAEMPKGEPRYEMNLIPEWWQ